MNPEQWLTQYDDKLKQAAADAERADAALRDVGGVGSAADGQVTVRVNASGATVDLVLRAGSRDYPPEHLAQLIMKATREAQRDAANRVVAVMREFVGDSPTLDVIEKHLTEHRPAEPEEPVAAAPARARRRASDDEYFENPPTIIK
ncbi:YbaB/EbfC DNA-binding family protein [Herbihabitans rhizosphaerae]|uniref:YbaB/EbfC DNA-binding family protein n=2 Tax=Herbihabitans rhizosphaerae TaxID=1872711 RepID=A0A4Q7KWJ4_9PSEU|nr:YbaB/EbfC DNA-binding family protein [Herbihabitans rhizosphaerae]